MGNQLFIEEPSTKIIVGEIENFKDIAPYKVLILINPSVNCALTKIQEISEKNALHLIIIGDGDYRPDEKVASDLIPALEQNGLRIEALTLMNLEVDSKVLTSLIDAVRKDLKALKISRVPLDNRHREAFNQKMNLSLFSLSYAISDTKDAFNSDNLKPKENSPFDVNQLDFSKLGTDLSFLELKGVSLQKETFQNITKAFSHSLTTLILEELKGKENSLTKDVLEDLKNFRTLQNLSLAGNNLNKIDFMKGENDNEILFPSSLRSLNLNACNLDNRQVNDILEIIVRSSAPIQAFHLRDCYVYPRTLENIRKTIFTKDGELPPTDMPKNAIDSTKPGELLSSNNKSENQTYTKPLFTSLQENHKKAAQYLTKWQQTSVEGGLSDICKREDYLQFFPVLIKALTEAKFFNDTYSLGVVDFSTKVESSFPKYDFSQLIKHFYDPDRTASEIDEATQIGIIDINLIQKVHPKVVSDDYWAKESFEKQKENFRALMKNMGYYYREKKTKVGIEDEYTVITCNYKAIGWDYNLATFSVIWYNSLDLVAVRFNLSDDWYVDKKTRINKYALYNMDYLVNLASEWNSHSNDFKFELDILNDGETEVKYKCSIMKVGDLNLAKLLLIAIDKGYIMLKALNKKDVFTPEDSSSAFEDAKQVRKSLKAKIRKYEKSKGFQALLKKETTMLG